MTDRVPRVAAVAPWRRGARVSAGSSPDADAPTRVLTAKLSDRPTSSRSATSVPTPERATDKRGVWASSVTSTSGDEPSADPLLKNGGASVENSGASCEPRWIRLCRCRINGRQGTAADGRRDLNWLEIVAR